MAKFLNKYQKSTPNLDTTIVAKGSPIGVSAEPNPIEKQVIIVKAISFLRSSFRTPTIYTRNKAAIIAVIRLDINPKTTTIRKTKTLCGISC